MAEKHPAAGIKASTRFRIYAGTVVVNVVAVVALGVLAVWDVIDPARAAGTLGYVVAGIGILSSGLALNYTPTRGNPLKDPTEAGGNA